MGITGKEFPYGGASQTAVQARSLLYAVGIAVAVIMGLLARFLIGLPAWIVHSLTPAGPDTERGQPAASSRGPT